MRRALRDFSDDARNADFAIIYFAGHGIEIQGTNYLIPIDAVLERDIDAFDEAIPLDRLLNVVEPARQLRLVILDACRDNPFAKSMKHAIALARRSIAGWPRSSRPAPTRWSPLPPRPARPPPTATPRTARSRPHWSNICRRRASTCARRSASCATTCLKVTRNQQEPFIYGSLGGNDVPLVPEPATPVRPTRRSGMAQG